LHLPLIGKSKNFSFSVHLETPFFPSPWTGEGRVRVIGAGGFRIGLI
jgi:hypothetical protein